MDESADLWWASGLMYVSIPTAGWRSGRQARRRLSKTSTPMSRAAERKVRTYSLIRIRPQENRSSASAVGLPFPGPHRSKRYAASWRACEGGPPPSQQVRSSSIARATHQRGLRCTKWRGSAHQSGSCIPCHA